MRLFKRYLNIIKIRHLHPSNSFSLAQQPEKPSVAFVVHVFATRNLIKRLHLDESNPFGYASKYLQS